MSGDMYPQGAIDHILEHHEFDEFDRAADQILAAPRAKRAPGNILAPPTPTPSRPKAPGLKKTIRRAVRDGVEVIRGVAFSDDVNTITNRVHKAVRPLLAEAFARGVEAGAEDLAQCCGCSGSSTGITNPYDGSTIS